MHLVSCSPVAARTRRPLAFVAALVALAIAPVASAAAQDRPAPPPPRNLRVLPGTTPRDSVVAIMRDITGALGVRCQYCHVGREGMPLDSFDFASDDVPAKETAREMMRMVARVNGDVRNAFTTRGRSPLRVECITCHRGLPRPLALEDTLHSVVTAAGADSAVKTYAALRQRYYGRFAFDFGERSLTDLAGRLAADKKNAEAKRMLELNAEQYPQSWNVKWELGRVLETLGDTAGAIAQYRKVQEMMPRHTPSARRLQALGAAPAGR